MYPIKFLKKLKNIKRGKKKKAPSKSPSFFSPLFLIFLFILVLLILMETGVLFCLNLVVGFLVFLISKNVAVKFESWS